jgi:hypothetical protein
LPLSLIDFVSFFLLFLLVLPVLFTILPAEEKGSDLKTF